MSRRSRASNFWEHRKQSTSPNNYRTTSTAIFKATANAGLSSSLKSRRNHTTTLESFRNAEGYISPSCIFPLGILSAISFFHVLPHFNEYSPTTVTVFPCISYVHFNPIMICRYAFFFFNFQSISHSRMERGEWVLSLSLSLSFNSFQTLSPIPLYIYI